MDQRIERLGRLLAAYSLDINKGDRVIISSDLAAMPLVRAFYRETVRRGGHPEILVKDQYCHETMLKEGTDDVLLLP